MSFDDQIRQALDRALTGVRGHLEADLRSFAHDLARAAAEERNRAIAQAAEAAAVEVRRQTQAQFTQLQDSTRKHAEDVRRSADQQIHEIRRAMDDARRTAEQQVASARAETDTVRREVETVRKEVDVARQAVDAARQAAAAEARETLVNQLAAAAAKAERHMADAIERTKSEHAQAAVAQTTRLADAMRTLDDASTLADGLDALAAAAAQEADRTALLVVHDERLVGWRLSGFANITAAARAIDLNVEEAGFAGSVVVSGLPAARGVATPDSSEPQPALPSFAQDALEREAIALPVLIDGTVVAVLYGDAPRADSSFASSRWPAALELLARHASSTLETLTLRQALGLVPSPTEAAPRPEVTQ